MPVSSYLHFPFRFEMVNADEIASLCYERFNQLSGRGKPEPGREWTLLAAVVKITRCASSGTGRIQLCYNIFVLFNRKCVQFR